MSNPKKVEREFRQGQRAVVEAYLATDESIVELFEAERLKTLPKDVRERLGEARCDLVHAHDTLDFLMRQFGGHIDPKYHERMAALADRHAKYEAAS